MLRLQQKEYINEVNIIASDKSLLLDSGIWENSRNIFKEYNPFEKCKILLIPVKSASGEVIAFGYQDSEANRELRMLKELRSNKDALQFPDIFPQYQEVVIYGCNELAVSFASYLEELGVTVSVMGAYWNCFGYTDSNEIGLLEGVDKNLVIFAEGLPFSDGDTTRKMERSVSPEFECIDKIYEANVLRGKIQDTIGNFDVFVQRLQTEHEIVIIGKGREAQDTYDLLIKQGIDICSFAQKGTGYEMLLGKPVMSVTDAMRCFKHPVFLSCRDTCGALGEEWTEFFDYYGYERNKQFYLVRDYTDIPVSNLVHVLCGKSVLLTGDEMLCRLLSDYLQQIEEGDVTVKYVPLGEKISALKNDILCLVIPDSHNRLRAVGVAQKARLEHQLKGMGFINYTKYFMCSYVFSMIDNYLNRNMEKYSILELRPKGVLIGRIPGWSGNVFFRGIMDGHPEILMLPYSDLNDNLFYYCIRLANCKPDDILPTFLAMYEKETGSTAKYFPELDKFETSAKRLLSLKASFTSQELFILFHIAYAEMINGRCVTDISHLVVYWEPHYVSRNEFPFFALWLEDKKIDGQTIALRRNNIVRTGSGCARIADNWSAPHAFTTMFADEAFMDGFKVQYNHWTEFKMRFEDIKVKPKKMLLEICRRLDIAWSDHMLETTWAGKPLAYRGSVDFDLKPVFNQYEEYLSEFDRFRISIASSPYQKKYGYTYENCLKFSRRELQDLFLKPFLFEEKNLFKDEQSPVRIQEWISWNLWKIRKHMVLNDIIPEFDRFELE